MFKNIFRSLFVVAALGACSNNHDNAPEVIDNDSIEVEAEAVEGSEFKELSGQTQDDKESVAEMFRDALKSEWKSNGISFFNCTGLARSKRTKSTIQFSIRGCTDDNNGDALINCAGDKLEPSLTVSRTILKGKKRKLTKTYEVPKSDISTFSRVADRISIRINGRNQDRAGGHRRTVRFRGFRARPGQLRFANFSNSKETKVLIFNFGQFMNGGVQSSIECTYN